MSEILSRIESAPDYDNQIDLHRASSHVISHAELQLQREIVAAQDTTPEVLPVTELGFIRQAGKNVYTIRLKELDSTNTTDKPVSQGDYDLAA